MPNLIPPQQQQYYPPHGSSPPTNYNHLPQHLPQITSDAYKRRRRIHLIICITIASFPTLGLFVSTYGQLTDTGHTPTEFKITSFNMTQFEFSWQRLTATWNFVVNIKNLDVGHNMRLTRWVVYVTYQNRYVAESVMDGVEVGTNETKAVERTVTTVDQWHLIDPETMQTMDGERNANGTIRFGILMEMSASYWIAPIYSVRLGVSAGCDEFVVEIEDQVAGNGNLVQAPGKCYSVL